MHNNTNELAFRSTTNAQPGAGGYMVEDVFAFGAGVGTLTYHDTDGTRDGQFYVVEMGTVRSEHATRADAIAAIRAARGI